MIRAIILGFLSALTLSSTVIAAETSCRLAKLGELPIRMDGLQPLVTVKINGVETRLLLDTGAFFSTLTAEAAKRLSINSRFGDVNLTGVGGDAIFGVGYAKTFNFAEAEFKNVDFLIGGPGLGYADGLLGQNVLANLDIEYDLANGMVRLFRITGCKNANLAYWTTASAVNIVDLEATDALEPHHVGAAQLNGKNIKVMFDTGASTSLLRRSAAVRAGFNVSDPKVRSSGVSRGIGRQGVETWNAPFASFAIGGEEIKNTRIRVGEMKAGEDMLLGADFFLSHRVMIAASQRRLFFTYNGGPVFQLFDGPGPDNSAGKTRDELADADAYSRRAAAAAARFDFVSAISDLDKAIALKPDDATLFYDRAMVRLRGREDDDADEAPADVVLADLDQAIKLDAAHVEALTMRGAIYLLRKDPTRAEVDFDRARALSKNVDLRMEIAGAYQAAQDYPGALREYDAWIVANPKDPHLADALNARCWARGLWNHELDKGLEDCDRAIKLSRDSNIVDSRALIYLRMGQYDLALKDYDRALKMQPKSAWSMFGRGLTKHRLGRLDEAATDIAAARALHKDISETWAKYGLTVEAPAVATIEGPSSKPMSVDRQSAP